MVRAAFALALMAGVAVGLQAAPNLVGQWVLNESAGPAVDATGGSDGIWNGTPTTFTPAGPISAWSTASLCVTRPGPQYVEIPNTPTLENVQEASYTIMAWFYPNSTPPTDTAAMEPNENEGVYGILYKTGWHEGIGYNNAQEFAFEKWNLDTMGANDWQGTATWGTSYPPGAWYHVAGVADFAAEETRIYVGGTLMNTLTWTAGYTQAYREYGTNPWRIGVANPGNFTNYEYQADGYIDDVRIYDRALTGGEIATIVAGTDMGAFVPPPPPPPPPPAGPPSTREGDEDGCSCSTVRIFRGFPAIGFAGLLAGLFLVLRRR